MEQRERVLLRLQRVREPALALVDIADSRQSPCFEAAVADAAQQLQRLLIRL